MLTRISPVDLVFFCIVLRIIYISLRQGPVVEFFKLLGSLASTFVALHYYYRLATVLYRILALFKPVIDCLAFLFLWLLVTIIFKLLREGFLLILGRKEENIKSGQWLAAIFAVGRSFMVCGMIFAAVLILDNKPAERMAQSAFSAKFLQKSSVLIYRAIYDNAISRIFPDEEFNSKVLMIAERSKFLEN